MAVPRRLAVGELQAFAQAQPQGAVLLDVRQPWELALACLRLPQLQPLDIPMHELPARLHELPQDRPILCLCHHGVRSAHVAAFLARQGFDDVINVEGGIDAWSLEVDAGVPRY